MDRGVKLVIFGLIMALGLSLGMCMYLLYPPFNIPAGHPDFHRSALGPCDFKPSPPEPVNPGEAPDWRLRRKTRGVA